LHFTSRPAISVIPLTDAWKKRQFAVVCRSRRALPTSAAELLDHLVAAGVEWP
jgi:hypothetical protein